MDSLLSPTHETPKRPAIFNRLGKATPIVAAMRAQENVDPNVNNDESRRTDSPMSRKLKQTTDTLLKRPASELSSSSAHATPTHTSSVTAGIAADAIELKRLTAEAAAFRTTIRELTEGRERMQREHRDALASKEAELHTLQRRLRETEELLQIERTAREQLQQQTQSALQAAETESGVLASRVAELQAALELAEKAAQKLRCEESAARQRHESLQQRYTADSNSHVHSLQELTSHIDALKRQYFFASALSLKLGLFNQGQHANETLQDMYEALQSSATPFHEWPAWIAARLTAATTTKRTAESRVPPQKKQRKAAK